MAALGWVQCVLRFKMVGLWVGRDFVPSLRVPL